MSANAPAAKPPVVLVESPAEGVRLLRINRPEARNALNMEVRMTFVPEVGHLPWAAFRPFLSSTISPSNWTFLRHFTQYAS